MLRTTAPLILASGSPRRKELLAACGLTFDVIVPGSDETVIAGESPEEMVRRLALTKAEAVAALNPHAWIIGADTTVVLEEGILGKPENEQDAQGMLESIQGRTHSVWGGFALVSLERRVAHVEAHVTAVTMSSLTPGQIRAYVETKEPMDKAGSYAAQGLGAAFIERINGSYTNVVGLELNALLRALLSRGVIAVNGE